MLKALSAIEVIIIILVISIVISFSIPKFNTILYNTNLTKLKTDVVVIQNGITNLKKKNILLEKYDEIENLDDANFTSSQKLFSKILDFPFISTSIEENKEGSWLKKDSNTYVFILSNSEQVEFNLENSTFICKEPKSLCMELY